MCIAWCWGEHIDSLAMYADCPHKSTPAIIPSVVCHSVLLSAVEQWTIMWCFHCLPISLTKTFIIICLISVCLYSGCTASAQSIKSTCLVVWLSASVWHYLAAAYKLNVFLAEWLTNEHVYWVIVRTQLSSDYDQLEWIHNAHDHDNNVTLQLLFIFYLHLATAPIILIFPFVISLYVVQP